MNHKVIIQINRELETVPMPSPRYWSCVGVEMA